MGKPSKESFYSRLNALAGTNKKSAVNESNGNGTLIDFQKSNEGTVYGIVKENHHYYIKRSNINEGQLDPSDFAYIGGLENKHSYEYNSLAEAEKQRNIYIKSLNEAFSLKPKEIVQEAKEIEKVDNPFNFLRTQINEGKEVNKKKFENKFKSTLKEDVETSKKKRGLMPEAADIAVKKALGLINEDAMSTADSEVKDGDKISDMQGKEKPQAPINDSNAKAHAEKAMGHDSFEGKKEDGGSIAVNQADKPLKEEASPLVTADTELIADDSLANHTSAAKEKPQAPINDANAKAVADKATAGGGASDPIVNNAEESSESDPLDDKEEDGPKKDAISVNEDDQKSDPFEENPHGGKKAMSTEDSDQKDADRVDDEKGHEKPEAPYNMYNQPDKGHKETKGKELKPKASKKDIVAEGDEKVTDMDGDGDVDDSDKYLTKKDDAIKKAMGDEKEDMNEGKDLSTQDSHIKVGDSLVNDTDDPLNKHGKSEIVADSEMSPSDSLANHTTTNLPNPVAEAAEALGALTESEDSLIYADSPKVGPDSLANESKKKVNEDELGDEIDQQANAASALDDLTSAEPAPAEPTPEPTPEPEVPAEPVEPTPEAPVDAPAEPEVPAEDPMDAPADDAAATPDAEGKQPLSDEEKNDIKSLQGEMGEILQGKEIDPDTQVELVNTTIGQIPTKDLDHNRQLKVQQKLETSDGMGEGGDAEAEEVPAETPEVPADPTGADAPGLEPGAGDAIDQQIAAASNGEGEELPEADEAGDDNKEDDKEEEVVDINTDGEEVEDECGECGPFGDYASSRGYDDVSSAGGMELANLLSGYASAHADGMNDGDFGQVVILLTPEIRDELMGYGHDEFLGAADAYAEENPVTDEEKLSPGSFDIEVPADVEVEEGMYDDVDMDTVGQGIGTDTDVQMGGVQTHSDPNHPIDNEPMNPSDSDLFGEGGIPDPSEGYDKLTEAQIDKLNSLTEEELNEIGWSDFKNMGKGVGRAASDVAKGVTDKVGGAMNNVLTSIENKIDKTTNQIKTFGDEIYRNYQKGVATGVLDDITKMAEEMGNTIVKLNRAAMKAGEEPIKVKSIFMNMANDIDGNRPVNLAKARGQFEGEEMGIEKPEQPAMEFVGPQNLGVSSPMAGLGENEVKVRNYIKHRLEEKAGKAKPSMNESEKPENLKKLDQMIDEQWELFQKQVKNRIDA